MPRLQVFVSDLSATGVVRNAIAIANEAAKRGYDVRLLTCNASGVLREAVDPKVKVIALADPKPGASRSGQLQRVAMTYRRHSLVWQPDVMLSAGNHGHLLSTFAWVGVPGCKILRLSNDIDHRGRNRHRIGQMLRVLKFQVMATLADRLVFVSRSIRDHPLMARHVEAGKAHLIGNGVDIGGVRAAALATPDHPWLLDSSSPTVLAVGRPVKQKNYGTLIRAFARASDTRDLRLIILGDGAPDEVDRLSDLANELGVRGRIDFVPAVSNPFSFMAAAQVLALPSLWEGAPNVLLEAMACGTPVIASRTAGNAAEILDDGKFGVLVDPRDVTQLADAIVQQTGPQVIEPADRVQLFDRGAALSQYVRLFDEVCGAVAASPDIAVTMPEAKRTPAAIAA